MFSRSRSLKMTFFIFRSLSLYRWSSSNCRRRYFQNSIPKTVSRFWKRRKKKRFSFDQMERHVDFWSIFHLCRSKWFDLALQLWYIERRFVIQTRNNSTRKHRSRHCFTIGSLHFDSTNKTSASKILYRISIRFVRKIEENRLD